MTARVGTTANIIHQTQTLLLWPQLRLAETKTKGRFRLYNNNGDDHDDKKNKKNHHNTVPVGTIFLFPTAPSPFPYWLREKDVSILILSFENISNKA